MRKLYGFLPLLAGMFFATQLSAQKNVKKNVVQQDNTDSVYFSALKFREIGPFRGGRSAAVTGSFAHKTTFYFGATGGGVWKTTDGGSNWKNITDKYFGGSIGAVAVAPSDESILYVGEGENSLRGNVSEGLGGMWRSDDGGRSWKNIGLKDGRHIIRIIIDPKDPNTVWAAVMGHTFGPNEERGVYKTTNGGKTWKRVLYVNNLTACSDLVMEPGNPNVLYAGMWHVERTPYSMISGGEGSGLYKSKDGGETWVNLTSKKGLPKGVWGIVGVAVAPSNTDKIYAIIENAKGGLFVSNDGGETWSLQSGDNNIRQRAWYYSKVFIDPKNENLVYVLNVEMMRSRDGGKTFQAVNTPHSDHHDLWIDPEDGNRMIVADDGGAQVSFNGGQTWSSLMNQPTAQIYRISTDNSFPYRILGAQQDNTTLRIKSRTNGPGIGEADWQPTAGAESGYVVADPLNPDIVYGGNYGGYLSRLDHRTGENRAINVWPDNPMGSGADVLKYRFQWNFPIFFSPTNPKKLYAAGNHLFVTENEGRSWQMISPDLTTNDKSKQASSGGPITQDNTSVEYYCTIFTAAESALEPDVLWAGSDDGLIHVSKDGGKNWQNVTPPDAGKWMMWNCVETDAKQKGKAYFAGTKYKMDDYTPYLYKTEDYGKTWKRITNGIPLNYFTRCIRTDKQRPGLLYAGTEYGLFISYNDGESWHPFQLNLPKVPVTDLTIKDNDLIVATQGRGFWVLDDLGLLQQKDAAALQQPIHVFSVSDAYRYASGGRFRRSFTTHNSNIGANPPNGVVFRYYLKNASDTSKVTITIFDKQGKPIETYGTKKLPVEVNEGMNEFVWDMNYPGGKKIDNMILWNGTIGNVKAAPGRYTAKFKFLKDSVEVPFTIKGIPDQHMSQEDYDAQVNFLLQIKDKFNEVQMAIVHVRELREQINGFVERLDTAKSKSLKTVTDSINKRLTKIEEALYQTKAKSSQDVLNYPIRINDKLAGLFNVVASGYTAPSQQSKEVYADLRVQADQQLLLLDDILKKDIPALNALINKEQLPVIGIKENDSYLQ